MLWKTQKPAWKSVNNWGRYAYMNNRCQRMTKFKTIKQKTLVFSFSCRRTFIDLHQTLYADRGRQYNFCHRQLSLDPIPSFCARVKNTFLGFLVPKFFFIINPSFNDRILLKLKHECKPQSRINVVSFIIFDQGIRRHGRK